MSEDNGTQQKGGPGFGLFGGTGPVMGGSAGGKDYSIGSMLGEATISSKGKEASEAQSRGDKLGGPVFSSGAHDLLQGTGLLQGSGSGLFKEGAKTSLAEARAGQGPDVSKADEDTRAFAAEGADPKSSSVGGSAATGAEEGAQPQQGGNPGTQGTYADDSSAGWSAEGAKGAPGKASKGSGASFTREEKQMLRGQGLMSLMSEEGTPAKATPTVGAAANIAAGQYTGGFGLPSEEGAKTGKSGDEDTQLHGQGVLSRQAGDVPEAAQAPTGLGQDSIVTSGNASHGDAATRQEDKKGFTGAASDRKGSEPILGSGRLAEKEIDLLHGQGVISKDAGEGRAASAPVGLGKDSILTSANPAEGRGDRVRTDKAGNAGKEDALRAEQSEIPEEEFGKQPSAMDAAWDAAGKVADKAKSLIKGGTTEE